MFTNYRKMRTEANENASTIDLAANGGSWGNRPTSDIFSLGSNNIPEHIAFIIGAGINAGTDPNDKTLSWKLYTWKAEGAPCEYVAHGTAVVGTQDVVLFPDGRGSADARNWVDTITITAEEWVGVVDTVDSGNNRICKLKVQVRNHQHWYMEITSADGATGTEAGKVSVWASEL